MRNDAFTPHLDSATSYFNRGAGFTLIELIIVTMLIMIFVALSTPFFKSTLRDLGLKDAAYNISKIIRYAEDCAIVEENTYKVVLDFENHSYAVYRKKEDTSKDEFERIGGRFGQKFKLPESAAFSGDTKEIMFYPNGQCDKFSVFIIGNNKEGYEIKSSGRSHKIEVLNTKGE